MLINTKEIPCFTDFSFYKSSTYLEEKMQHFITRCGEKGVIRKVVAEDARNIINYHLIIAEETDYLTFGKGEVNTNIEFQAGLIKESNEQENFLYIIAEINHQIVGILRFSSNSRQRRRHTGEFGITVLRDYWSQGIGTELMNYLIKWATESQLVKKLNLKVRSDNEKAFNLYRKMGFKQEGIVSREFFIYGVFYSGVLMGLEID